MEEHHTPHYSQIRKTSPQEWRHHHKLSDCGSELRGHDCPKLVAVIKAFDWPKSSGMIGSLLCCFGWLFCLPLACTHIGHQRRAECVSRCAACAAVAIVPCCCSPSSDSGCVGHSFLFYGLSPRCKPLDVWPVMSQSALAREMLRVARCILSPNIGLLCTRSLLPGGRPC